MSQAGSLDIVNLVGMEYVDNGKSLRLEVVDSLPPHETRFLTFKNVFAVRLYQSHDDGFPFVVCELTWRTVGLQEEKQVLARFSYPFFDSQGLPLLLGEQLVVACIEGSVSGEILAEKVDLTGREPGGQS